MLGRLAQLVEHLVYTERVSGSSPLAPTIPEHDFICDKNPFLRAFGSVCCAEQLDLIGFIPFDTANNPPNFLAFTVV